MKVRKMPGIMREEAPLGKERQRKREGLNSYKETTKYVKQEQKKKKKCRVNIEAKQKC